MSIYAENVIEQHVSEVEVYIIDFRSKLKKNADGSFAETLTGATPTVAVYYEDGTDASASLTLASKAVNTSEWVRQTDLTDSIGIGCGVQFKVSGGTAGKKYKIVATCVSTLSLTKVLGGVLQIVGT